MPLESIAIAGLVALGIVGFIALLVWAITADGRRSKKIQEASMGAGWQFQIDANPFLNSSGPGTLPLFQNGHSRSARNLLTAPSENGAYLFDYRYVTGSGKHQQTHLQTVAAFRAQKQGGYPTFMLRPEGFFDKIGQTLFKSVDFDFPSHPDFSKRFLLRGPDEAAVRAAFDYGALSFFERERQWVVEANGPWLIAYKPGRRLQPQGIVTWFEDVRRVSALFPR